ncbi:membrane protein DedA with SNARE-associated domain [Actinocorallia herbida]|uniref:Membrane protein DedA with SNARE-associated domain n=1 Tax=Actinocorallia herbida TaxID=58109 RepID=A0A3N1D9P2_9ACTN|nr:DedA family protein [Actinocorallia herbida]ROO90199.1 membrane protein DedA with SNARE-associated domain [Actinocorallia herbida]
MHLSILAAQTDVPADGIAGWATDLIQTLGGPGAGLLIALENLFPPLPSEVILPLTGFTAGQGKLSLFAALFWTTLGAVVGAAVLYWIGRVIGRERMYRVWERMPLVKVSDLEKTEAWFAKHGTKAVFFGRMVPIFRSLISVPAGVEKMPMPIFLLLTAGGSLIWNSILVLAGYWLGDQWHIVETYVGVLSKVVLVIAVIAVIGYVVVRFRGRGNGAPTAKHRAS